MSTKNHTKCVTDDSVFITLAGIADRHCSSVETVKRTARREGWTPYRMGGRVIRFRLSEVLAYEERCARLALSYPITPPSARSKASKIS